MRSLGRLAAVVTAVLACACSLDTEGLLASDDAGAAGGSGWGGAASGGSSGSAAAAGAAASGAGGGRSGPEDCLDGIDNDGNGSADCADPACQPAYACVPAPPAGFSGYAFTRGDAFGAPPGPPCADGSSPARYLSQPLDDLTCDPCSCAALTGGSCGDAPLSCSTSSASCASATNMTQSSGDCKNGDWQVTTLSCKLGAAPLLAEGSCAASGGGAHTGDPFAAVLDVCRALTTSPAGCPSGELCVARGVGDYSGYVCVEQPAEVACPVDWGVQIVGYEGADDDRTCTPCSCTPQGSQCAGAEYTFWDVDFCIGGATVVSTDQCKDLSGLTDLGTWSFRRTKTATVVGACTPSGGQPSGSVKPQKPVTFCCRN